MDNGESIGVTVIEVGPCVVTQVRNIEKDGYIAAQIGFEEKKKLNKPQSGHLKELGLFGALKEFRVRNAEILDLKVGDKIDAHPRRHQHRCCKELANQSQVRR